VDLEATLLDAIRDDADDDTPRLVLADWLMEQDDPVRRARGEFVALECRLARMEGYEHEWESMRRRADLLCEEYKTAWLGELGEAVGLERCGFVRGMVSLDWDVNELTVPPRDVVRLAEWRWVDHLHLMTAGQPSGRPSPADWVGGLDGIVHLSVSEVVSAPAASWQLTLAPEFLVAVGAGLLPRLASLHLMTENPTDLQPLLGTPGLATLGALDLGFCRVNLETVRALAQSPHLAGLRTLALRASDNGTEAVRALATSPYLRRLSELTVYCAGMPISREIRDVLGLREEPIGDAGARALANSPVVRGLRKLTLWAAGIGLDGMRELTGTGSLSRLEHLSLRDSPLGDRGARLLASSPYLGHLRSLDLSNTGVGADGCAALAAAPQLGGLRELVLIANPVGAAGARALAGSPHLRHLRLLDLSDGGGGDAGAAALASSPQLAGLVRLRLARCGITNKGGIRLADSAHLGKLSELRLQGNSFSPSVLAALRHRFGSALHV
jgi:uncharacterized protein (TIGR02996 family)